MTQGTFLLVQDVIPMVGSYIHDTMVSWANIKNEIALWSQSFKWQLENGL